VILSGEYAILAGGTAIALPAPRCLRACLADAPPPGGYPPAAQAARVYPLPELAGYEDSRGVPHMELDASGLYTTGADGQRLKLGLGSSAAEVVAVLALRYVAAGKPAGLAHLLLAEHALAVHTQVQGGLGSGLDVMVAALGCGLRAQDTGGQLAVACLLPEELAQLPPLALVPTGVAAGTRVRVGQFNRWREDGGAPVRRMLAAASAASAQLADAWTGGDWPALLAALELFSAKLRLCLDSAGVEYMLPVHHELAEWARGHGGYAKPTGAGGGDMALLIGALPYSELGREVTVLNPPGASG
jgi:phosphomevalonate kinase